MHAYVQEYLEIHDKSEKKPHSEWINAFVKVWSSNPARKEWLKHFSNHPHHQWMYPQYDYLLVGAQQLKQLSPDVSEKELYQLADIMAKDNVFDYMSIHSRLNIHVRASTVISRLQAGASYVHMNNIIPIDDSPNEAQAFIKLLHKIDFKHVANESEKWLPIFWYALTHDNRDIRAAIVVRLIDTIDSPKRIFSKIVPKDKTDNPKKPFSCWNTHPKIVPKIIDRYLPELVKQYTFYKDHLNVPSSKALYLAHEESKTKPQVFQELSLDINESSL